LRYRVVLVLFLLIVPSSVLTGTFSKLISAQENTVQVVFEFSEVMKPAGDIREVAVAFHSISFLDAAANSIGELLFGTPEANKLQEEGWYGNEERPGIGSFQWAGGTPKKAAMQLLMPEETEGLLLNITSITDGIWMNVTVDGKPVATLRVDAYWHSAYVPVADTPIIPRVGEPEWVEGHCFPTFPSTERIYAIHVRSGLEDWWGLPTSPSFRINASYEMMMALTLVGMQGLVNRYGSSVYLDWEDDGKYGNSSRFWIPLLQRHVEVVYLDLDGLTAVNFLFRRFSPRFAGAVIYDPDVPDTINLATMLAGLDNRIILAPEQVGLPEIPSFSSVIDLRLLAEEQGWDATEEGEYRLYRWVYENLWPRLEHRIIGVISPGPPTSRACNPYQLWPFGMAARDYIVALRLTALWLSPSEEPQESLFDQFLEDSPSPIPVFGFFSGEEQNTVSLAARHGDWVPVLTNPGVPLACGSLTVLSGVRPAVKPYPSEIDVDHIFATLGDTPVATIWSSDGDSIQFLMDRGFYGAINFVWPEVQGHRFSWSINPTLVDLAPLIWNYYVESRSEVGLLGSVSGGGYTYPGLMTEAQLHAYLAHSASYLKEAGLRAVWVDDSTFDWRWTIPWEELAPDYYEYLRQAGYVGAIVGGAGPRWGLGFEYGGAPTPAIRTAYTLNSTNEGWIIQDLLTRKTDQVFVLLASYPWHYGEVTGDASALSGETVVFSSQTRSGLVVNGPYATLAPGNYNVTFRVKVADNKATEPLALLFVGAHRRNWVTIEQKLVSPSDFAQAGEYQDFTLSFTLDSLTTEVEFRINYYGGLDPPLGSWASTDMCVDYINATKKGSLGLPVFAAVLIPLVCSPQRLTEAPQLAEDLERSGGVVLPPEEFIAALNPEFMIEWAAPILGSEHPALDEARQRLAEGDQLTSLLTVRDALRTLPERTYLLEVAQARAAVTGNTSITDLAFNSSARSVSFLTHGPPKGTVQASIVVPNKFLIEPLVVRIDGLPQSYTSFKNSTHTTLQLEFFQGPHQVDVSELITTTLTLSAPTSAKIDETIAIAATLRDSSGNVMSGCVVTFMLDSTVLGQTVTDPSGVASIAHKLAVPAGTYMIRAIYQGSQTQKGAEDSLTVTVAPVPTTSPTTTQPTTTSPTTTLPTATPTGLGTIEVVVIVAVAAVVMAVVGISIGRKRPSSS